MGHEIIRQSNFNGGELSPFAHGRRDLKAYASMLALGVNHIPTAEGPIRRRPGLAHVDVIRNRLEAVSIEAAMLTAPHGGDVAALMAGTGFITDDVIGTDDPHVLLEIDFGAPTLVAMFDLTDFALVEEGGDLPPEVPPQYPWNPHRPLEVLP